MGNGEREHGLAPASGKQSRRGTKCKMFLLEPALGTDPKKNSES